MYKRQGQDLGGADQCAGDFGEVAGGGEVAVVLGGVVEAMDIDAVGVGEAELHCAGVHQIDEACWMKNAWPVKAQAIGGRHFREDYVDQNFDVYSVEYTFEDGSKFFFDGRTMNGCYNNMSTVVHGSNGSAIVSDSGHTPGRVRTYRGQRQHRR